MIINKSLFLLVAVIGALVFLIIYMINLRNQFTEMDINHKKLYNYRLQAYHQLNNALSGSSISSGTEIIYHSLFYCSNDYFNYKNSLIKANIKTYWFSKNTSNCLNEYIKILDQKSLIYGIEENSTQSIIQSFSTTNYELFESSRAKLIRSIKLDKNVAEDIVSFLTFKNNTPQTQMEPNSLLINKKAVSVIY